MQEVKFLTDATTAEIARLAKSMHEQDVMSVKEEVEQDVINKSVTVDTDWRITTALLPLMFNLLHKLAINKDKALHIYNQQVKKLNQNPQDKEDVIQSEVCTKSWTYGIC